MLSDYSKLRKVLSNLKMFKLAEIMFFLLTMWFTPHWVLGQTDKCTTPWTVLWTVAKVCPYLFPSPEDAANLSRPLRCWLLWWGHGVHSHGTDVVLLRWTGSPRLSIKLTSSRFQALVSGEGLNDDQWHTVRFSRRGENFKLQVDEESPTIGKDLSFNFIPHCKKGHYRKKQ